VRASALVRLFPDLLNAYTARSTQSENVDLDALMPALLKRFGDPSDPNVGFPDSQF